MKNTSLKRRIAKLEYHVRTRIPVQVAYEWVCPHTGEIIFSETAEALSRIKQER